jgi:para-nitrobenzyl esterase
MPSFARAAQLAAAIILICAVSVLSNAATDQVTIETGKLQGTANADGTVRMFKGVPFAAPPVGELRWKAPQPAIKWEGVRQADKFGPACLQTNVFGDIYFRDAQPSEDCLNLDIWIPAKAASAKLPVLLWFYGGGFVAGSASEPRYDGETLAKKGVIVVNPNYRLGSFGFFAHPELTKESPHHASGNYGLLDQLAALEWVVKNIAAFGGDPKNITIAGESAGSFSVSALMASPLSRNLFQKAMGESGAFFPNTTQGGLQLKSLAEAEKFGVSFADSMGAKTLAEMRAKPADDVLQAAAKQNRGFGFGPIIDGHYFPEDPRAIYAKGQQAHVPLLAGWNADEGKMTILFSPQKPTAKSFAEQAQTRFGDQSKQFLKLYPATTDEEALQSAEQLSSDDFIAFSTWKWIDTQRKTGVPVYEYHFEQVPKTKPGAMAGPIPASEMGSKHAGEIEYVFGTLKSQEGVPWTDDDFKVSDAMSSYWANFVKSGNPNGTGLPEWPKYDNPDHYQVMHLVGTGSHAAPDTLRPRYEFLDAHAPQSAK